MQRGAKYGLQDILFQITENGYTFCRIYDGWQSSISDDLYPIRVLRENENAEQLRERVAEFVRRFNCPLTLFFKNYESNTNKNAVLVHYRPDDVPEVVQPARGSVYGNDERVSFAVEIERLKAEMREREIRREKADLENELEDARAVRAKWDAIADAILPKILPLFGVSSAVIGVKPMQGTNEKADESNTADAQQFEAAIDYLCDVFGIQGMIDLADLLKRKPEFINLVKSQLS